MSQLFWKLARRERIVLPVSADGTAWWISVAADQNMNVPLTEGVSASWPLAALTAPWPNASRWAA